MKSDEQLDKSMDEAEAEIKATLKKHGLYIGIIYEDGVALTLGSQQKHANGDIRVYEREIKL